MSTIEDQITKTQEKHAARLRSLRATQAREDGKVRAAMLTLLEQQHPDQFAQLKHEAARYVAQRRTTPRTAAPSGPKRDNSESTDARLSQVSDEDGDPYSS